MSIEMWNNPNDTKQPPTDYKIGTIGWEFFSKPEGIFDFFKNVLTLTYAKMIPDMLIPTYGSWSGPGWSGGSRSSNIIWSEPPCYKDSIKAIANDPNLNPNSCISLLDAICKVHDWRYDQADKLKGNDVDYKAAIMQADIQLLLDIATASQSHEYTLPSELSGTKYTGTFDITESKYINYLVPLFTSKIMIVDDTGVYAGQAIEATNSILAKIPYVGTIFEDPADPFKKTIVDRKDGVVVLQNESKSRSDAWITDLNIFAGLKPINVTISYGDGSTKAEDIFELPGDKIIRINGGSGNDEIKIVGANGDAKSTYTFEINGGGGYDTYYLDSEFNYKLIDSGKNRIYIEDGNGGWIDISSNFYAYGAYWLSGGGSVKLSHNSPWTLTFEDGSTVELGADFQPDNFGINLINVPTNPTTTNTIIGEDTGNYIMPLADTAQNDRIEGRGGDDWIGNGGGSGGNDWLQGNDGNDLIQANTTGYNIAEGNAGSDCINGGAMDDKLFGGDYGEMDQLIAAGDTAQGINARGDLVDGRQGNDFIYGSDSNDALLGGAGKDLLVGGGGDDAIFGDDDIYTPGGGTGNAFWDGWSFTINSNGVTFSNVGYQKNTTGDDDIIYAGTGNDFVDAGAGDDEVYGGSGSDTIYGFAGNDFIEGGEGDDVISGDANVLELPIELHGDDYIDGGDGNDLLYGEGGNDELYGGTGNDTIYGGDGDDYIDGEAGENKLFGDAGNDVIFGGDDADWLEGEAGDDYLDGGLGNDTLLGGDGNDELFGGAGNDHLQGDIGNDYLDGEAGNNYLVGGDGNDTLIGADGNDTIYGGAGDDYIDAGDGNNTIYGEDGSNEIYAGAGNDLIVGGIEGGTGSNYIDAGDGNNTLFGGDGSDEIYGGAGDDYIDGFVGDDYLDGGEGNNTLLGGAGNDQLFGGSGIDILQGDAGDDYLDGELGNDTLLGGDGNDTLFGGEGNDSIWGGAGNDTIYGEAGNDQLLGEAGNDYIYGGEGDDWLQGGTGNDTLIGGAGNDIYVFDSGDGVKTIIGYSEGNDTLAFGPGINPEDVTLVLGSLELVIGNNGDRIIFTDFDPNDAYGPHAIDNFVFDDGRVLTYSELIDRGFDVTGASGDDQINGTNAGDRIMGLAGNDYIVSGAGNDVIDGGTGDDTLIGGIGNDTLQGNAGDDTLYGSEGNDKIDGGEGNDYLYGGAGNDTLKGGEGNDTLAGGAGIDYLMGGAGDDTYIFNSGDGSKKIVDLASDTEGNTLLFGEGITPDDLQLQLTVGGLNILIGNNGDIIHFYNFDPNDAYGTHAVDSYVFADGTVLSYKDLIDRGFDISGTAGDDQIDGTNIADRITGLGGNDTIYGGAGNDSLDGGVGNDYLYGGGGNVFFNKVKMFIDNRLAS